MNSIQADFINGVSIKELAVKYRKSERQIYRITEPYRKHHNSDIEFCRMEDDWNNDMHVADIMQKYGYASTFSVYRMIINLRKRGYWFKSRRLSYVRKHKHD